MLSSNHNRMTWAAAFFCAGGWVYTASATGEDSGKAVSPGVSAADVQKALDTLNTITDSKIPTPGQPAAAPAAANVIGPAGAPNAPILQNAADESRAASAKSAIGAKAVQVSRFDTVSLDVQNTELASVLQMLSIQSKRNIVPSPKVTGSVTANLYDVTFHEAMDAILQQNGAGYVEKGNFIYVYTLDELKKIQDADRKVAARLFKLNYITAKDASTFVTPLLSTGGSIAISGQVAAGFQPTISDGGANSYAHAETMVIRDYPENLDEVGKIIKLLDTPPAQVLVEATVLQADLNEDLALGVDVAILGKAGIGSFAGPIGSVVDQMIGGTITGTPGGAGTTSVSDIITNPAVKIGVITNNVAVFVKALDKVTDTTVLANPKILALNRQKAEILVGQKIAYLSTTATATATTQTVEFLDTGTQLTLRPFISEDGMIRMELKPSISDAKLRTAGDATLPDQTTQELTTNVMVPDGQTIVLGGLFKEQTTVDRSQVPGLGDIPIVGYAFKANANTVRRTEVIFLITPHIVKDNKSLAAAGAAAAEGVESVTLGARESLLGFSRSKLTASHMRDALKHLEKNEKDKALYEVDQALSMDPRFTEARRLKENLTGQRVYEPNRGSLNEAMDVFVEQQTGKRPRPRATLVPNPTPGEFPANAAPAVTAPGVGQNDAAPAPVKPAADAAPAKTEPSAQARPATQSETSHEVVTVSDETPKAPADAPAADAAAPTPDAPAAEPEKQEDKPTENKDGAEGAKEKAATASEEKPSSAVDAATAAYLEKIRAAEAKK
jgi:type IV pilus assembly protein PilQ